MSSGPPNPTNNSGQHPPEGDAAAKLREAVEQLRDLVKITKSNNQYQAYIYTNTLTGNAGGGGVIGRLAQPRESEYGFPRRWEGVEGSVRYTAAGFKTFGESTGAVMGQSTLGRWMMRQTRGAAKWAKRRWRRTGESVIGRTGVRGVEQTINTALALVMAFIKVRDAVDRFTNAALDRAKELSYVSGSMAAVTAEREIRQMMRDYKKGEATAGTARELMEAESNRKEQEDRLEIIVTNATNKLLTWGNRVITGVLTPIADRAEELARRLGLAGDPPGPVGLAASMDGILAEHAKLEAAGRTLMDIARDAGIAIPGGRGVVAPAGAAGLGRLP